MTVDFKTVSASKFASMTKDPYTFYIVQKGSDEDKGNPGYYDVDGNTIKTWAELEASGLKYPGWYTIASQSPAQNIFNSLASGTLILPEITSQPGQYEFYNCTTIKKIVFGEGTNGVSHYMCQGCTSLETIILPETGNSFGMKAFNQCNALSSIVYQGTVSQWEDGFCWTSNNASFPKTISVTCTDGISSTANIKNQRAY